MKNVKQRSLLDAYAGPGKTHWDYNGGIIPLDWNIDRQKLRRTNCRIRNEDRDIVDAYLRRNRNTHNAGFLARLRLAPTNLRHIVLRSASRGILLGWTICL